MKIQSALFYLTVAACCICQRQVGQENVSHVTSNETTEDISHVTSNESTEDISHVTSNDTTEDISHVTPNDTTEDISHVTSNDTTEDINHVTSNETTEDISHVTSNETTEDISHVTSNETTENISHVTSNETTKDISHVTSNETTEDISHVTSNETTENISHVTSNDTTEDISHVTPNDTTEDISHVTLNDTIEDTSHVTPNHTADETNDGTADKKGNASNDTAAYIKLVKLQAEHCRPEHLCSLSPNASLSKPYGCCTDCSCDDDCVMNRNCCADYFVFKVLNRPSFDDVTEFISVLDNNTAYDTLIVDNVLRGSPFEGTYRLIQTKNDGYKCSPTSLYPTLQRSTIRMKSSCPVEYQNDTIIKLCEVIQNKNIVDRDLIYRITPVTAVESGIIYRNQYCFMCNSNDTESGLPWNMYYELDNSAENMKKFFSDLDDLFQVVSGKYGRGGENVRFISPAGQNSPSKIDPCISPSNGDCDEDLDSVEQRACRLFSGPPVTFMKAVPNIKYTPYTKNEYITVKNIACLSCLWPLTRTTSYCHQRDGLLFLINDDPNAGEYLNRSSVVLLNVQSSPRCDEGFIFDELEDMCRQILCPMYWYNQHGGCRLMFTNIVNGIYSIGIAVSTPWKPKPDEKLVLHISDAFNSVLNLHFHDLVPRFEHSIWEYPEVKHDSTTKYFVNIRIKSGDVTYMLILRLLSNILQNVVTYINIHGVGASVAIADDVISNTWIGPFREFSLVSSGSQLTARWSNNITLSEGFIVHLRKANLCYRISTMDKELSRVGRKHFVSTRTHRLYTSLDVQFMPNTKMNNVACIDSVEDVPDEIMYMKLQSSAVEHSDIQPKARIPEDFNSEGSDDLRGIWTLAVIVCLGTIIVAVPWLRNRLRMRMTGSV